MDNVFFPNASFEEDTPNLGWPDGWERLPGVEGRLVGSPAIHGSRSICFTRGYNVLGRNFVVRNLAKGRIMLTCAALSPDGARLGLIAGFQRGRGKGRTPEWKNVPFSWDLALSDSWRQGTYAYAFPADALDGRLFIGIYRSNDKGTLYLDDLQITFLPGNTRLGSDGLKQFSRLHRDLRYLKRNVKDALPGLREYERKLSRCYLADDRSLKELAESGEFARLRAAAVRKACPDRRPLSWVANPCGRQSLENPFPSPPVKGLEITALTGEWQALGMEVANPDDQLRTVRFALRGFEAFDQVRFRRAVFTENWYEKERTLTADPLTLLKDDTLVLEPGEHIRLYLSFKTRIPGVFKVSVDDLTARIRVLPARLPDIPFGNCQFLYPWESIFSDRHLAHAVRDLAEHYVTDVEFPDQPKMSFHGDGTPAEAAMAGTRAARLLKAFGGAGIRSMLYWAGRATDFHLQDSRERIPFSPDSEQLTPQWEKAYAATLKTFMDYARGNDLARHVSILPWDEINSGKAPAPGPLMRRTRRIFQLTGEAEPGLPRYVTCGYATMLEDVLCVLPHVDTVMVHWPQPDLFDGKKVHSLYVDQVVPRLKQERRMRGLDIWSYHVEGGRASSPDEERAYALGMAGWGVTGIGTWAYYVPQGSSWSESDGGMLDYVFVYDGLEDHPLCRKYNPAGEAVVPSLRWEALRLGIQDARILLALKSTPEVRKIKGECEKIAITKKWDIRRILEISRRIRILYQQQQ